MRAADSDSDDYEEFTDDSDAEYETDDGEDDDDDEEEEEEEAKTKKGKKKGKKRTKSKRTNSSRSVESGGSTLSVRPSPSISCERGWVADILYVNHSERSALMRMLRSASRRRSSSA
jgi:hypothetical protein